MQMCWVCTLDCVFECVHTTVADFSCSGNKCVFAQLRSIINLLSILECVHSHLLWQAAVWIYSKCQPVQPAISIINLYSKIVPGCDAPLAVCVSLVTTCMFVPPPPSNYCDSVTASPLSSIFDPSLKPCNLISPVCPQQQQQQQQALWHSRWQWPQERRVHPQQQSTLAPYRHRPLEEAICRGHLWGDDIISSQPIKMSSWKAGVFSVLFGSRLQSIYAIRFVFLLFFGGGIWTESLRIEGDVCCTDCAALWGKFVTLDFVQCINKTDSTNLCWCLKAPRLHWRGPNLLTCTVLFARKKKTTTLFHFM